MATAKWNANCQLKNVLIVQCGIEMHDIYYNDGVALDAMQLVFNESKCDTEMICLLKFCEIVHNENARSSCISIV